MENRIDRKNDEALYQPKVHSDRIRELYNLKQVTGLPMTVLLDQAIRDLAASYGASSPFGEEPILEQVDQETWEEISEYRGFLDGLEYQRCLDELEAIKSGEAPEGESNFSTDDNTNIKREEFSHTIYDGKQVD